MACCLFGTWQSGARAIRVLKRLEHGQIVASIPVNGRFLFADMQDLSKLFYTSSLVDGRIRDFIDRRSSCCVDQPVRTGGEQLFDFRVGRIAFLVDIDLYDISGKNIFDGAVKFTEMVPVRHFPFRLASFRRPYRKIRYGVVNGIGSYVLKRFVPELFQNRPEHCFIDQGLVEDHSVVVEDEGAVIGTHIQVLIF